MRSVGGKTLDMFLFLGMGQKRRRSFIVEDNIIVRVSAGYRYFRESRVMNSRISKLAVTHCCYRQTVDTNYSSMDSK
jgi:hypothetical protein